MAYETGLSMEERVTSLFQPDTLLPEQFLDTYRRKLHLEPEKKLMLAILEDAVACYQKYFCAKDIKGKALFEEAADWIRQEGGVGIFAFESVCEGLGLNPEYVRRGLESWKENSLAQRAQAKVYPLKAEPRKHKRAAAPARRSRQRLRRAAGR